MKGARSEASARLNAFMTSRCPKMLASDPAMTSSISTGTGLTHTNGIAGVNTSDATSSWYDIVTRGDTLSLIIRVMNIKPAARSAEPTAYRLAGL